ncbi:AMP-binding protein [Bounagaea algeriensis]
MTDQHSAESGDEKLPRPLARLLARRARARAEATFLQDARSGRRLSYTGVHHLVQRYDRALTGAGVPGGGRVLVDVVNPLAFAGAYLGLIASGRCAVPVNPKAPIAEVHRDTAAAEPCLAITDRQERFEEYGLPALTVDVDGPAGGHDIDPAGTTDPTGPTDSAESTETAADVRGSAADAAGSAADAAGATGSALLVTSGSTSAPKAVELSEHRLLHVAAAIAAHNGLTEADRGYNSLPLFHINAEVVALLASLHAGACLVLDERFQRHGFWERMAALDVTWINAVPAILTILSEEPVPARPPRLRFVRSASAPLPTAVRHRISQHIGAPVVESYGMTEAASQITATPLDGSAPEGSCGRPVGVQLEVRGAEREVLPVGEVGEVWIRGSGVITGYVGGRAAERFDADGWLDTRDVGYTDTDGFVYLVGRADDVINRGGENIYPREIEEVVLADPQVHEVAVVGKSHEVLGAVPVAHVIPEEMPDEQAGRDAVVERLNARCAERLSRFKQPEEIRLVPDFPRASTGKVQRHRLHEPTSVPT